MDGGTLEAAQGSSRSRTLADLLPASAARRPEAPALRHKVGGAWVDVSYGELERIVGEVAGGLIDLGIQPGDRVAVASESRPEWTWANLGTLAAGGISVPIYPSNSTEECRYILEHSEARAAFVEDAEQLAKVQASRAGLPSLEHVVVMAPDGDVVDALPLDRLRERGRSRPPAELADRQRALGPDDPCGYIYTSGTTGLPKGCMLSHGNMRSMVTMAAERGLVDDEEVVYLFLPLAHAFGLVVQFLVLDRGGTIAYWERDRTKIVPNLAEVRPTSFPAVPRVFQKAHDAVLSRAEEGSALRARLFRWALGVGREASDLERQGGRRGRWLGARHAVADRLVLGKIRALFGDRLRKCVSGAAPVSVEVLEFFHACGVTILDMYGLTEASPGVAANDLEHFRFGSVGRPFAGLELRLADDGEVLVRGPNVFQGYYKDEQATRRALVDGWLHTGDLGRLDGDGFLYIIGREKEIIVTAGGENVAPAKLENALVENPWVSHAVVVGDDRPYLAALLTLDPERAPDFAERHSIALNALPSSDAMRREIQRAVDGVNARVGRVEQIRRFAILPHDLSEANGELTPSYKVRRSKVMERYAAVIDELYAS